MQNKILISLVVLLVAVSVSFSNWGLTESSEARYAEISREMFLSGDYLHPRLLGISHFHKPPVTYYITCFGFFLFGVNEFAVRFFPALALLLQLFFVYKISRLLTGSVQTSVIAMLLYFGYPLSQIASANLTTDVFLATFIFGAVCFYLQHRQQQMAINIYLVYIFSALAFLTKGPVGVLPVAVFCISYHFIMPRTPKRRTAHHLLALVAALFISLCWFLVLVLNEPKLLNYFLGHQLVDRVASNSFGRTKPFWYYFVFIPLLGLPAILLFLDYLAVLIRRTSRTGKVERILLVSFLSCFVVFSLSASKLVLYVLPLYLFVALLSAIHISRISEKRLQQFRQVFTWFNAAIFLLLPVAAFISIPGWKIPMLPVFAFTITGLGLLVLLRLSRGLPALLPVALIGILGVALLRLLLPFILKENELSINSIKPLANRVKQLMKDPGLILVYDQFLPSMAFYTGGKIVTVYDRNDKARRETEFEVPGSAFESGYFDVGSESRLRELERSILMQERVVVARRDHDLPETMLFLRDQLTVRDTLGNWVLYHK